MAVVSRIATIKYQDATTLNTRTWQATAAVQDTAAGASVTVTITNVSTGASPPSQPDIFSIVFKDAGTTPVKSVTLNPTSASQTTQFVFTDTGNSGGANRSGTIEIYLEVTKTSGAGASQYHTATTGVNTPPTGFTAVQRDQGYIRGSTTVSQVLSNSSLGGALSPPFQYSDSIYLRSTLAAPLYVGSLFTSAIGSIRTFTPSSAAQTTVFDAIWSSGSLSSGNVNFGFPAAATVYSTNLVSSVSTLTGIAEAPITVSAQSATFDPRVTWTHYMQINDNTYPSSPPNNSKAVTPKSRRSDQSGQLFSYAAGARGLGVNVTYDTKLVHTSGFTISQNSRFTTAINGQDGWSFDFTPWVEAGPSGNWTKTNTFVGVDPAYSFNATDPDTYMLIALDPDLGPIAGGGSATVISNHWHQGDALILGVGLFNDNTGQMVSPDASPAPLARIFRFDQTTGKAQYLKADLTWADAAGATVSSFTMSLASDGKTFLKLFSGAQTTGWGDPDLFVRVLLYYQGYPYRETFHVEAVSSANGHDRYKFDGPGFVGFPTR